MVTFTVDLYHDGLFASNPLRLVLEKPLSFFYVLPGVPMNIGYDVLEMINDDRHCEDKSDSDFEDIKKGDNLDDVKDIVDFQTEGEESVDISKLSIDDPWLNKLVGKGRFVGEMEDPIPGLKGRFFVEQNDPDENFVEPKYKVQKDFQYPCFDPDTPWNEWMLVLVSVQVKEVKKQVQINDSLDKDKGKVGEGSSHKDLGKRSAGRSSDKGKGKLGKDRSEPSKVSQATKERWRKKKLEEKENLKNAVDCPFRLWASWMSTEKSFQIKTIYPDHNLYGYVYLLKHKHEVFENFKVFKSEVELQLGKKIKALRSDRGGEYLSQEFKDYLSKAPNLSYLKVWGCEVYVKGDSADKLHQRSVKCIFVGYPKETIGYYFYFPPENKVIVARYENFFERDLISQKFIGRDNDLEDDYMDTFVGENTTD
nr:zinc finger, CCHC-type [Tanacetum cinerariifolium]